MSELPVQYIKFIFPVDKVSSNVAFLCQTTMIKFWIMNSVWINNSNNIKKMLTVQHQVF